MIFVNRLEIFLYVYTILIPGSPPLIANLLIFVHYSVLQNKLQSRFSKT